MCEIVGSFGIALIPSPDVERTAYILSRLSGGWSTPRRSSMRPGFRPKRWFNRAAFILCGFPGIGRDRAKALLLHFGSLNAILSAKVGEIMQVPGIGKKTADRLFPLANRGFVSEQE
jgi:ERCC4-type nuclease